MIERFFHLPAVSSFAGDIDFLIGLITVLVGFWFFLAQAVFFGLIFRYRHREGRRADYITGDEKEIKRPITIAHMLVLVCDVVIVFFAVQTWYQVKQDLPPADATVRVITQQWAFSFVHPGPDRKLDTADDIRTVGELHVEVGKTYHYLLESRDVLHDFSVPVFRLKQDAVPGRVITGWFRAKETGVHDIQCAEICGIGHGLMPARIVIESPVQHAAWMARHASTALAANLP